MGGGGELLVGLAGLSGLPPFKLPVDFPGVGVPPLAHPVFEAGKQDDRDGLRRGRRNRSDNDLGVRGDERALRWDRCGLDLDGVSIRPWHSAKPNWLAQISVRYRSYSDSIDIE